MVNHSLAFYIVRYRRFEYEYGQCASTLDDTLFNTPILMDPHEKNDSCLVRNVQRNWLDSRGLRLPGFDVSVKRRLRLDETL